MSASQILLSSGKAGTTLMAAITAAALTANLQLCLDAGDSASYSSGQKWLDRSGNGYDWFLGENGSVAGDDPTFVGNAGGLESYWASNGNAYFKYDAAAETWMQNLHKNNATLTLLLFAILPSPAANSVDIFATQDNVALPTGTWWRFVPSVGSNGIMQLIVQNAVATVLGAVSDPMPSGMAMVAVSLNEATGAGGGFFYRNGAYVQVGGVDTFNSTYSSPSAGNATGSPRIGFLSADLPPTSRIMAFAAWSAALSKANLDALYAAMRGRFGI